MSELTAHHLRSILGYNPETGAFVWVKPPKHHPRLYMTEAGTIRHGYVKIKIDGKAYSAHRLAWLYVNGEWPEESIDHINGNPSDNRMDNLRPCNHYENTANAAKWKNKSLPKGVRFVRGLYQARITKNKKQYSLGYYKSPKDAHEAYMVAAVDKNGEFARFA